MKIPINLDLASAMLLLKPIKFAAKLLTDHKNEFGKSKYHCG